MSVHLELAHKAYSNNNPSAALHHLTDLYEQLSDCSFPGGVRAADELLETIGQTLWSSISADHPVTRPLQGNLILATVVFPTGGHTPVIKDLAEALSEKPCGLWLTMAHRTGKTYLADGALPRTGLAEVARIFDSSNPWECTRKMVESIAQLRPAKVFLLHHPNDCIAVVVAAAAAAMGCTLCLLHHSDAQPTCGLFLKNIQIVDFTPRVCAYTRTILNLPSAWVPLASPDPGSPLSDFMSTGRLRTALSGSSWKVKAMSSPNYPKLVANILAQTEGTHIHIGPLSKKMKRAIDTQLHCKGLKPEQFQQIPKVQTLAGALYDYKIDLMLNTYPHGGARTAVEAMSAGIPMLWRSRYRELDLWYGQTRFPEAMIWREEDDLLTLLKGVDREWLQKQGDAARSWYLLQHHPSLWQQAFSNLEPAFERKLPKGYDATLLLKGNFNNNLEKLILLKGNLNNNPERLKVKTGRRPFLKRLLSRISHKDRYEQV